MGWGGVEVSQVQRQEQSSRGERHFHMALPRLRCVLPANVSGLVEENGPTGQPVSESQRRGTDAALGVCRQGGLLAKGAANLG